MTRRLPDWVDGFVEFSRSRGSPEAFRRWAAISAVAGALERKVWLKSNYPTTYPNLFVILVGTPGSGKSVATDQAIDEFLRKVDGPIVAPNSVSRASLMDSLADAKRPIIIHNGVQSFDNFNAMTVHARELGVLIPSYDNDFMAHLTDLYDGKKFEERKRGGELHIEIEKPWLNFIGDCTPSYLATTLPEGAWEQGFMSRCILIFSPEDARTVLTFEDIADTSQHDAAEDELTSDLRQIGQLYGRFQVTVEAANILLEWENSGRPPKPSHPRLQFYCSRRLAHLFKLCMISSASRTDELIITDFDARRALGWLLSAEAAMPNIFNAMLSGGDASAMRDCADYIRREHLTTGKPVSKSKVLQFIGGRVPAYNVAKVLELMLESDQIRKEVNDQQQVVFTAGLTVHH